MLCDLLRLIGIGAPDQNVSEKDRALTHQAALLASRGLTLEEMSERDARYWALIRNATTPTK